MRIPGVSAFLAIVRTQSLNRAAVQLNLSQSTVSKRLQALEQEIGIPLIERGKGQRSIQLTPGGEAFVDIAERWDGLWKEMLQLRTAEPNLSLRIAMLDSVINSVFPGVYTALMEYRPNINLKISTLHSTDMYESIERREFDVAFSLLELANAHVEVRKVYREKMVVIRLVADGVALPTHIHPQELDSDSELYVRWGPSYQLWHDRWWNPFASGRIMLDSAQLILSCAKSPNEWAIVPHSFAHQAQEQKRFVIQELLDQPPERIVYILTHRNPKASSQQSIAVFNQCLDSVLGKLAGFVIRE